MRRFFLSLVSGDESEVDALIFCTILGLLSLIGISVFVAYVHPDQFSPVTFSTSLLTVIGAGAGGKTARDRWSSGVQSATVSSPGEVAHVETKP